MGEGQGELFVAAPARRLVVPAGDSAWWGVDPSTRRVVIATVTAGEERGVSVRAFPSLDSLRRLPEVREGALLLASEVAEVLPPGIIYLEQPSGGSKVVSHPLEFAVGCIASGLLEGVQRVTGRWPKIELVTSSYWKKTSCGSGGIRKTFKAHGRTRPLPIAEYGVWRWATAAAGYPAGFPVGTTTESVVADEVDAWAIAECARRDVELVPR